MENITENIINKLNYIKLEKNNSLLNYQTIDINEINEVYCNDDWYILIDTNGNTTYYIDDFDVRSKDEMKTVLKKINRSHVRT